MVIALHKNDIKGKLKCFSQDYIRKQHCFSLIFRDNLIKNQGTIVASFEETIIMQQDTFINIDIFYYQGNGMSTKTCILQADLSNFYLRLAPVAVWVKVIKIYLSICKY